MAFRWCLNLPGLPGRCHLRFREPPRERKVQALAGDDRLEIGVLAERAPIGGAEAAAAFAARLAAGPGGVAGAAGPAAESLRSIAALRLTGRALLGSAEGQQGRSGLAGQPGHH
jgi:hypothetical protein